MNTVVDDYNEIRPWLDKEMGQFGLIGGPVLNIGMGLDGSGNGLSISDQESNGNSTQRDEGTPRIQAHAKCLLLECGLYHR